MAPKAPATERRLGDAALVLCAHGIRGGVGAAAGHAERIAARGLFAEVHACALKGRPGWSSLGRGEGARDRLRAAADGRGLHPAGHAGELDHGSAPCGPPHRVPADRRPSAARRDDRGQGAGGVRGEGLATRRDGTPGRRARHRAASGFGRHGAAPRGTDRSAARLCRGRGRLFWTSRRGVPEALAALGAPHCVAVGLFVDRRRAWRGGHSGASRAGR